MGKTALERNIAVHDKIARKYEATHGEIYNGVEQARLRENLRFAVEEIATQSQHPLALDFGCGAGNLTKHLTDLGCDVIAADVSTGFLDLVASRTYARNVTTLRLNGVDLEGVEDESVDMVAMYSVLHHVPDYLSLMKEFSRVLKPGGVLYIDHEASDLLWKENVLTDFTSEMKKKATIDFRKYFVITNYIDRFLRMFINPKYQREGDIHVFADDHIEWFKIREELKGCGIEIVREDDYLLYRRNYDVSVYEAWKEKAGDMHFLIGRKIK